MAARTRLPLLLSLCCFLPACGGGGSPGAPPPAPPRISLLPAGGGWSAEPVDDDLASVSHNGLGYTGEIDVYEVEIPVAGRLQVSLSWKHGADFDVILASDVGGKLRLAEGSRTGTEPEYVGLDVAAKQIVFLLVAGWEGDPGGYTLEMLLLPPGSVPFDVLLLPDPAVVRPANAPIVFEFNTALDAAQTVSARLLFVGPGQAAEGRWCIDGAQLTFLPRLPLSPGDPGGLRAGDTYTVQFPRAARGLRAANGEYLDILVGGEVRMGTFADHDPATPPRVTDVNWNPAVPWTGTPVVVTLLGAIDPSTAAVQLVRVAGSGAETALPVTFKLDQQTQCVGNPLSYLTVTPTGALPPASTVRLRIPGTVRRLGGTSGATGPAPAPPGAGFAVDFRTP